MKRQAQSGNIIQKRCSDNLFPCLAGRSFTKLERAVAQHLAARQQGGEISDLKFQQTVHLSRARVSWRVDFSYMEDGQLWYHEAKGREIEPYPTKLKLYRVYGPAPLRISKATSYRGGKVAHKITETIYPAEWLEEGHQPEED